MRLEIVLVTPEIAAQMLRQRPDYQRALIPSWVKHLAGCMARGEWLPTHEAIAFDTAGNLIDGQHRLGAVVLSGVTVTMTVLYGADEESYRVIGDGKPRRIADHLAVPRKVGEVIGLGARMISGSQRCSTAQAEAVRAVIGDAITELLEFAPTARRIVAASAVRLAAAVNMISSDRRYAMETYRALSLHTFGVMPPVAQSFLRQVISGSLTASGGSDLFVRGLVVLNVANSALTRLQLRPETITSEMDRARAVLRGK